MDHVPVAIVSDTQLPPVAAGDQDGTLLLCSPSSLLHTDVAQATLKSLDKHEEVLTKQVYDL